MADPCNDVTSLADLWNCFTGKKPTERYIFVNGERVELGDAKTFESYLLQRGGVAVNCDGFVTGNVVYLRDGKNGVRNGSQCFLIHEGRSRDVQRAFKQRQQQQQTERNQTD